MFPANWDPEGEIWIEWMESIFFGGTDNFSKWSPAAVVFYDRDYRQNAVFEIIPSQDVHLKPISRLLDPNSIDFDRIRRWLQLCSKADLGLQAYGKTGQLPGFRLVHCRSGQITEPPQDCLYVALSYVWGKGLPDQSRGQCFPQTIEDTIRVCLELGFEHICTCAEL
jgi:hypothetical protein